jgi:phosphonopyruvate decarboxylase
MIQPFQFLQQLSDAGVQFYTGVPDSLLKGLIAAIDRFNGPTHHIAVNEGAALALAAGYHLATGGLPVVYLQNSGLGNLINPLTSLADREVYSIPVLLIIGWRGEPGVADEPQHMVMGRITPTLLHQLHVPFVVIKSNDEHEWRVSLQDAVTMSRKEARPVALLIESGVFPEDSLIANNHYELSAEEAIRAVYASLAPEDIVVCTTGKIGRAFYKINEEQGRINRYFLNVGSMGHAISIASGLALHTTSRVVVFDGDGALLMHMGALALPPSAKLSNLFYIVLNNGAHQSVGSQPTLGFKVDFCAIAKGCGYKNPVCIKNRIDLNALTGSLPPIDFLEIRINTHTSEDLPRPKELPQAAKERLMTAVQTDIKKDG